MTNGCPYYKSLPQSYCCAYPNGLMIPSIQEVEALCTCVSFKECRFYRKATERTAQSDSLQTV